MLVGTPSGVTLAPEGGAHQSIGTPLIGMAQDGLASLRAGLRRRAGRHHATGPSTTCSATARAPDERTWLRDETGGSVYLRLSTRPLEQPLEARRRRLPPAASSTAPTGCASPGPNANVVIAYQGAVAPEAIEAAGLHGRGPPRCGRARPPSPRPTGSMPAGGVEHFGQTGTIADLYRHYGIDAAGIIAAAEALAPRRPIRYARRLEETISG
jgi:pyruvate dehydrogenase E1 component